MDTTTTGVPGLAVLAAIAEEQGAARSRAALPVQPSRRPVAPHPRPQPVPPVPEPPRRELNLPTASASYRDGLRPTPEPDRVRPYLIAAELRRQTVGERAGISWLRAHEPDPVPGPSPDLELARRVPGESAPPPLDPRLAVPAASTGPPSAATLQHVLAGLQSLDSGEPAEDAPTVPLAVIRS